jgi:hypothetical protein
MEKIKWSKKLINEKVLRSIGEKRTFLNKHCTLYIAKTHKNKNTEKVVLEGEWRR